MSTMADAEYLDELAAFVVLKLKNKSRKRTIWAKEWLLKRSIYTHTNILEELRAYPTDFNNFLRIDESTYLHLLKSKYSTGHHLYISEVPE